MGSLAIIAIFYNFYQILKLPTWTPNSFPLKSHPDMVQDSWSLGKSFEDGAELTCDERPQLGEEIAAESHGVDAVPLASPLRPSTTRELSICHHH